MPHPYDRIVQATVVGDLHGEETNNVMNFGVNGSETLIVQLAVAIVTCLISTFKPMAAEEWTLTKVQLRTLWPVLTDPVDHIHGATVQGAGLPGSPSFVANLMRIRTGLGGRSNRGRNFWPGVIENDVTRSRLTDAGYDKFLSFCSCLASSFIAAGAEDSIPFEIGVLSRTNAKKPGQTIETAFTPATSITPVREVARMGSRKIGVGS